MVVGIGVDACEVRRVARELARNDGAFRERVFTPAEISDCTSRRYPARHFAARFAAKEAVLKALGTGLPDIGALREVEVRTRPGGAPELRLHARLARTARSLGVRRLHLSLTHTGAFAIASVVLESGRRSTANGGRRDR